MPSRRLFSWLFALALLFGQAAAFAHALGHVNLHESTGPDKVCEVCVAQAHLSGAAPISPLTWALPASSPVESTFAAPLRAGTRFLAASARAPPAPFNT